MIVFSDMFINLTNANVIQLTSSLSNLFQLNVSIYFDWTYLKRVEKKENEIKIIKYMKMNW